MNAIAIDTQLLHGRDPLDGLKLAYMYTPLLDAHAGLARPGATDNQCLEWVMPPPCPQVDCRLAIATGNDQTVVTGGPVAVRRLQLDTVLNANVPSVPARACWGCNW